MHLLYITIRWNRMLILEVEVKKQQKSKPDINFLTDIQIIRFIDLWFRPYGQFFKLY